MKDLAALRDTVEAVRAGRFSELPAELVARILEIEAATHDDRLAARERVKAAIADQFKESDAS